jgi:hypothetical protein
MDQNQLLTLAKKKALDIRLPELRFKFDRSIGYDEFYDVVFEDLQMRRGQIENLTGVFVDKRTGIATVQLTR